jgi:hypothetical protein
MPTPRDHKRFCENDGWVLHSQTDHYHYRKFLPNGEVLKTKVSMNNKEYGSKFFMKILKEQLRVTKEEFNEKI